MNTIPTEHNAQHKIFSHLSCPQRFKQRNLTSLTFNVASGLVPHLPCLIYPTFNAFAGNTISHSLMNMSAYWFFTAPLFALSTSYLTNRFLFKAPTTLRHMALSTGIAIALAGLLSPLTLKTHDQHEIDKLLSDGICLPETFNPLPSTP